MALRRWLPRSLKSLLLSYEVALLLLVVVTGALGGMWTHFWAQSSRESVRLNALLFDAQQIRGDLYGQLRLFNRAVRLGEPIDREQYRMLAERIAAGFADLDRRIDGYREQVTANYMRRTYDVVRADLARLLGRPDGNPPDRVAPDRARILDPLYEEWMLAEFESAQVIFARVLAARREALEQRLDYWTGLAPWLIALPVLLAVALVLLSRLSLQRRFLRPMRELVETVGGLGRDPRADPIIEERGVSEVVELTRAFNQLSRDLAASRRALVVSERQAALGALVPVVAHNIRNPLAGIRATAQLLDHDDDPDELRDARDDIIVTVDRLERWVGALLAYLHPLRPYRQSVDLIRMLDGALQPLAHRLTQRRLDVQWSPRPASVPLEADPALLEQALHGLLNNAIEASPVDAELTLGVYVEDETVEIRLEDRGPGLPFQPEPDGLKPGPTTKRFGTGLGIPFAFKVVEAHGGQLVFDPRPGGGTRVRLRLPRRSENATIAP